MDPLLSVHHGVRQAAQGEDVGRRLRHLVPQQFRARVGELQALPRPRLTLLVEIRRPQPRLKINRTYIFSRLNLINFKNQRSAPIW